MSLFATGACEDNERSEPRVTTPRPPRRVAAESAELRQMLAEITAKRACDRLGGMFRPIKGKNERAATGVAWLQECEAFADGTDVTLQLAGRGWRWIARESDAAGATFEVDTYVRFKFSVEVKGAIDVAYATDSKIFTLWFTPDDPPRTTFDLLGDVDVDEEGIWASVVGGAASLFGDSPEARAGEKVTTRGREAFATQFAKGITLTVDLCSGDVRSGFGHAEAGEVLGPAGDARTERATIHPGGLLLHGPLLIPPSGLQARVEGSGVTSRLVCQRDADRLAQAFISGLPLPAVPAASEDATCPLVHALQATGAAHADAEFRVSRLAARLPALASCGERTARK